MFCFCGFSGGAFQSCQGTAAYRHPPVKEFRLTLPTKLYSIKGTKRVENIRAITKEKHVGAQNKHEHTLTGTLHKSGLTLAPEQSTLKLTLRPARSYPGVGSGTG